MPHLPEIKKKGFVFYDSKVLSCCTENFLRGQVLKGLHLSDPTETATEKQMDALLHCRLYSSARKSVLMISDDLLPWTQTCQPQTVLCNLLPSCVHVWPLQCLFCLTAM